MTDVRPPDLPPTQTQPCEGDRPLVNTGAPGNEMVLPLVAWATYLMGWGLVGLVIAYVDRKNGPPHVRDNYTYMIRTFWIGLLYGLVMLVLWGLDVLIRSAANGLGLILAGVFVYGLPVLIGVWFIVRCVKGIVLLVRAQPVTNVETWLV